MENDKKLTKEELLEMESAPRTNVQKIMDVIICFGPLIAAVIMFAVYYLAPNISENKNPHVFTIFVCFFLVLYGIMLIRGFVNKSHFGEVRYKAPLYTFLGLIRFCAQSLKTERFFLKVRSDRCYFCLQDILSVHFWD